MDHVAQKFQQNMNLVRNEALPHFYKGADTAEKTSRLIVETHMDDFHGSGRRSEVTLFLQKAITRDSYEL